jgi:hypothetical protein
MSATLYIPNGQLTTCRHRTGIAGGQSKNQKTCQDQKTFLHTPSENSLLYNLT